MNVRFILRIVQVVILLLEYHLTHTKTPSIADYEDKQSPSTYHFQLDLFANESL